MKPARVGGIDDDVVQVENEMDAKGLRGLPVIAIHEGNKVGLIDEILFDADEKRLYGFLLGNGGFFRGSIGLLELRGVASIGNSAVMIENRTDIQVNVNRNDLRQYPSLTRIRSLTVVTRSGSAIGTIATVQIDRETGRITEIEVTKPGLSGVFESRIVMPADQVAGLGRDVAVVPDSFGQTSTS